MAWINTMTGCFRLSGFSRRYFRELVNSLLVRPRFAAGRKERAKYMCSKRAETSLQTVRSRLRHHRATTLALKPIRGLLFFSPYRASLSPFGVRELPATAARSELVAHAHAPRTCTHIHTHTHTVPHVPHVGNGKTK